MEEKEEIRQRIWKLMEEKGITRFPRPCYHRIPNFVGAEEAAERLRKLEEWRNASVVKVNPDSPQRKVRELALRDGKTLLMPTPRLRQGFLILKNLKGWEKRASTIKGAFKYGRRIGLNEIPRVDLVVVGSVAVDLCGGRVGKSKGYSDLELAILSELNLVNPNVPIITTVHQAQIVDKVPMLKNDIPVDFIITPSKVIKTSRKYKKPSKIYWELIDQAKLNEIPILQKLRG